MKKFNCSLSIADRHHIEAAEGWLEAGNHLKANEELEKVSTICRAHPFVLVVRCSIYFAEKQWPMVYEIASMLTTLAPEDTFGWLQRSHALHCMGQTGPAWKGLHMVARRFKLDHSVSFAIARYAILGKTAEASAFLANAFHNARMSEGMDVANQVKLNALNDPHLKSLWPAGL